MRKRQLLIGSLGLGALMTTGYGLLSPRSGRASTNSTPFVSGSRRKLPIPPLVESINERPIELTMKRGASELLPGIRTPTMGFNGSYLGPTVRLRNGQQVPIVYRNTLAESVAVHSHGLHVPGDLDGGPQREIQPGDEWSYELPVRQHACTSWYRTTGHAIL